MTTTEARPTPVTEARREALAALHDSDGNPVDAIAWASAHLAAMERTLLRTPVARDVIRRDAAGLPRLRTQVYLALRRLEQHVSGDGHVVGADAAAVCTAARIALEAYARVEDVVVEATVATLSPEEFASVTAGYWRRLMSGPTRPHPHLPHDGVLGAIAYRVDAVRDHLLDTLDSRHVPLPRPRKRVPTAGRWSRYLLGVSELP